MDRITHVFVHILIYNMDIYDGIMIISIIALCPFLAPHAKSHQVKIEEKIFILKAFSLYIYQLIDYCVSCLLLIMIIFIASCRKRKKKEKMKWTTRIRSKLNEQLLIVLIWTKRRMGLEGYMDLLYYYYSWFRFR